MPSNDPVTFVLSHGEASLTVNAIAGLQRRVQGELEESLRRAVEDVSDLNEQTDQHRVELAKQLGRIHASLLQQLAEHHAEINPGGPIVVE